jgi:hypothetical protein
MHTENAEKIPCALCGKRILPTRVFNHRAHGGNAHRETQRKFPVAFNVFVPVPSVVKEFIRLGLTTEHTEGMHTEKHRENSLWPSVFVSLPSVVKEFFRLGFNHRAHGNAQRNSL